MVEQGSRKVKILTALIILAVVIFITAAGVFLLRNKEQAGLSKQTFLTSVFNNSEQYADVFLKLKKYQEATDVTAGIISHHFLAKQLIADFYNRIGNDKHITIFLASPDHYNSYFKPDTIAYTSKLDWNTPFGTLKTDNSSIQTLLNSKNIEIGDSILGMEHGIYVEAPFIKKFFPNAEIVPLVFKNSSSDENFLSLGQKIKEMSTGNSLFLVSSDFSHNSTIEKAHANDKKSIEALNDLNKESFSQITNDCRQCLAALSGFLGNNQNNFYLINNENSFNISGQDENSVTSYISGYYSKKDYVQILFAGDLMFDRGIRYYAEKNNGNEFIFDKISFMLQSNDLVAVNLEGPITDNKSISLGTAPGSTNNYFFTFDPSVAKTLFNENIRLVDLGNNHITNFGNKGATATESYLDNANVSFLGAPIGIKSIIKNINGIKIAFVSYNEFAGDVQAEQKAVINEIESKKLKSDLVVVFSHWGIEYSPTETEYQKELAHKFIDAGADLIIGSHPHVIEPMETYNGKRIYYSLGNFVFDQYFNEDVRNGLGVVVKIDKKTKQMDFSEQRFYLDNNGQTIEKIAEK
jgi:poly-gamma-glutamate synthesis protein (capsule biosynthesis protein)